MEAIKYDDFTYHTYEEYLGWEDRWELIDGVAYAMSPAPYPSHQNIVLNCAFELKKNFECSGERQCQIYISPIDWKINKTTVVQPDVAIFCEKTKKQFFSKTPPLIIEVLSRATALKDVTTKFELYQKEGVTYYIIIEPTTQIADIFKLHDGKYQLLQKATRNDNLKFEMEGCKTRIDFGAVFEA